MRPMKIRTIWAWLACLGLVACSLNPLAESEFRVNAHSSPCTPH